MSKLCPCTFVNGTRNNTVNVCKYDNTKCDETHVKKCRETFRDNTKSVITVLLEITPVMNSFPVQ